MAAYLLRRLWQMIPTLLGVVLLVFILFKFFGGDPAEILGGLNATPEQVQAIRDQLGLNQPWYVQLGIYLKGIVTLNWGESFATHEQVSHIFATRLPATLTVMTPILVFDTLLALPVAMWVAYRRGSVSDRAIMIISTVALSVSFLVYIILGQYVFGFELGWFPVQGWSDSVFKNLVTYVPLPVMLALMVGLAPQTRLYRTFFLDELGHDYVRTARAKGIGETGVLLRNGLRNAAVPVITVIGTGFALLISGVVVTESVFNLPGIGRLTVDAVLARDYPVIQAMILLTSGVYITINLLIDVAYTLLDPRIRY
jgi:peptide/nickel transport system permease protein